jgi:hypothetical protein
MTSNSNFWRHQDNDDGEFASADEVFTGPSQVFVTTQDTYSVVEQLDEKLFTVVKGTVANTRGMKATHVIAMIDEAERAAAVRAIGMSQLVYDIANVRGDQNLFRDKTFYSEKDMFLIENLQPPVYAIVNEIYEFMDLDVFGRNYAEMGYSLVDYILQVLEIARDLFSLIGTMNALGIFHRHLDPEAVFIATHEAGPATTATTSTSTSSTEEGTEVFDRVTVQTFDFSCALLSQTLLTQLIDTGKTQKFRDGNLPRSCIEDVRHGQISRLVYGGSPDGNWTDPKAKILPDDTLTIVSAENYEHARRRVVKKWSAYESYSCARIVEWLLNRATGQVPDDLTRGIDRLRARLREVLAGMTTSHLSVRTDLLAACVEVKSILSDPWLVAYVRRRVIRRRMHPPERKLRGKPTLRPLQPHAEIK